MGLEPVAAPAGRERLVAGARAARSRAAAGRPSRGRPAGRSRPRPRGPPSGRSITSGRPAAAGRRSRRRARATSSTSSSPRRQHSQIWRPLASAGKSISPVSISRSVMPQLVDPGDARLHLVDDALHPEAEERASSSASVAVRGVGRSSSRRLAGRAVPAPSSRPRSRWRGPRRGAGSARRAGRAAHSRIVRTSGIAALASSRS